MPILHFHPQLKSAGSDTTGTLPNICSLFDLLFASNNFLRLGRSISRNRRNITDCGTSARNAQLLPQLRVHTGKDVLVLLQEGADVLAALSDALALVAVPCAALVDDVVEHREIEDVALARDALAVENVELGVAERRRYLVFNDLYLGA
jgi:hypothetical protein